MRQGCGASPRGGCRSADGPSATIHTQRAQSQTAACLLAWVSRGVRGARLPGSALGPTAPRSGCLAFVFLRPLCFPSAPLAAGYSISHRASQSVLGRCLFPPSGWGGIGQQRDERDALSHGLKLGAKPLPFSLCEAL